MARKKAQAKKKAPARRKRMGPPPGTGGRPPVPLDWEQIEAMAQIQCTQAEIACVMKCHIDTLNNRCKAEYGITFSEFLKEKSEGGKASLRRAMWKSALGGDRVMMIWVSKNVLGWKDKHEHSGDKDNPLTIQSVKFGDKEINF